MTKEQREEFLLELYEHQINQGHSTAGLKKDQNDPDDDYREKVSIVEYWNDKGLVDKVAHSTHFINFKLTSLGIDYVEENLK